jgi:hypothetical protein
MSYLRAARNSDELPLIAMNAPPARARFFLAMTRFFTSTFGHIPPTKHAEND